MSAVNVNRFRKAIVVLLLSGTLGIVAVPQNSVTAAEPQKKDVGKAVGKLILAAAAEGVKLSKKDQDGLLSAVVQAFAKIARDKLIDSALKDLMPDAPTGVHRGIRRVACMYLDGELTIFGFTAETAKEEFIEALKAENVKYGHLAQGADFLYELHKAFRSE